MTHEQSFERKIEFDQAENGEEYSRQREEHRQRLQEDNLVYI